MLENDFFLNRHRDIHLTPEEQEEMVEESLVLGSNMFSYKKENNKEKALYGFTTFKNFVS